MLTHKIIKVKPHIQVAAQSSVVPWTRTPKIKTQAELDDLLERSPVVGNFIRFRTASSGVTLNEFMVNYVLEVENDIAEIQYDGCGDARTHCIIQLGVMALPNATPRWMSVNDYTILTAEEFDKVVNADVQNRIQKYLTSRK